MKFVLQSVLPRFAELLAADYRRWAKGDTRRRTAGVGELSKRRAGAAHTLSLCIVTLRRGVAHECCALLRRREIVSLLFVNPVIRDAQERCRSGSSGAKVAGDGVSV